MQDYERKRTKGSLLNNIQRGNRLFTDNGLIFQMTQRARQKLGSLLLYMFDLYCPRKASYIQLQHSLTLRWVSQYVSGSLALYYSVVVMVASISRSIFPHECSEELMDNDLFLFILYLFFFYICVHPNVCLNDYLSSVLTCNNKGWFLYFSYCVISTQSDYVLVPDIRLAKCRNIGTQSPYLIWLSECCKKYE